MQERPTKEAFAHHRLHQETHKLTNPLRDVILGGQDGLVNALGIILGIAAVTPSIHILIATVLAATAAESISMGAVAYTSAMAQKDHYESERRKAEEEIEKYPEMEKEEVRQIFEAKGFNGKVLEEIVTTLSSDKKIWLNVMMAEELRLQRINSKDVIKSSVIVTITTAIGHLIPLIPFFFVAHTTGLIIAVILSAITLFAVGVYQAVTLVGSWWKTGIKMVCIGLGAALLGYIIAKIFHATGA